MRATGPVMRLAKAGTAAVTVAARGASPATMARQKVSAHGSQVPGRIRSGGCAWSTTCRSSTTRVTTHTSQPRRSCSDSSTPQVAAEKSPHGATSRTAGATMPSIVLAPSPFRYGTVRSSADRSRSVVGVLPGGLVPQGGLLLGLALQPVGLPVQLRGGVPVGLAVHLLGAADQLLDLGLGPVPDAHGPILRRTRAGRAAPTRGPPSASGEGRQHVDDRARRQRQ